MGTFILFYVSPCCTLIHNLDLSYDTSYGKTNVLPQIRFSKSLKMFHIKIVLINSQCIFITCYMKTFSLGASFNKTLNSYIGLY